eukprot:Skav231136  [mRNA]  locus=scaffold992:210298:211416:+ [translate_table: standard]
MPHENDQTSIVASRAAVSREMGCHWASALQLLQVLPRIDIDAVLLTAAVSACEKACDSATRDAVGRRRFEELMMENNG